MDTQFGIVPRESFISLSKASKLGFFFFFTFIILNKEKKPKYLLVARVFEGRNEARDYM